MDGEKDFSPGEGTGRSLLDLGEQSGLGAFEKNPLFIFKHQSVIKPSTRKN